ncbi:MAG: hypothetical protein EXX96DRAFT_549017, partial [Benjaminiella poitrasii]
MPSLLGLPIELQLIILDHVKAENHINLAPIAQTCWHFSSLIADNCHWNKTITISQSSLKESLAINYLINALKINKSYKKIRTTNITALMQISGVPLITHILENQAKSNLLNRICLYMPSNCHENLYKALINNPLTELEVLSIHDPLNEGYVIPMTEKQDMLTEFVSKVLVSSCLTLRSIYLPALPSNTIITDENQYVFPKATSVSLALTGECQSIHDFHTFWRKFKFVFPSLEKLHLTLSESELSLFRHLLTDASLFPWVKELHVKSKQSPKEFLLLEEIKSSLFRLDGLERFNAGWDVIKLL